MSPRGFHTKVSGLGPDEFKVAVTHPDAPTWDKAVGYLTVDCYMGVCAVGEAFVHADWRRMGVATRMYRRAAKESSKRGRTFTSGKHMSLMVTNLWWFFVDQGWAQHVGGSYPFEWRTP